MRLGNIENVYEICAHVLSHLLSVVEACDVGLQSLLVHVGDVFGIDGLEDGIRCKAVACHYMSHQHLNLSVIVPSAPTNKFFCDFFSGAC